MHARQNVQQLTTSFSILNINCVHSKVPVIMVSHGNSNLMQSQSNVRLMLDTWQSWATL